VVAFSGKIHLYAGIGLWLLLANGDLFLNPILFLLGCILPDADHRRSLIGKILPLWLWFRHRGAVHSVWFMLVCFAIAGSLWHPMAGIALAAGVFLHLIMDSCTPSGVRWL